MITALGPARGFLKGQNFVELRALPSIQGVVLQPLADDLTAELAVDKITDHAGRAGSRCRRRRSGRSGQQLVSNLRALTFDTQLWSFDRRPNSTPGKPN